MAQAGARGGRRAQAPGPPAPPRLAYNFPQAAPRANFRAQSCAHPTDVAVAVPLLLARHSCRCSCSHASSRVARAGGPRGSCGFRDGEREGGDGGGVFRFTCVAGDKIKAGGVPLPLRGVPLRGVPLRRVPL